MLKCLSQKNYTAEWLKLSDQALQISALSLFYKVIKLESQNSTDHQFLFLFAICYFFELAFQKFSMKHLNNVWKSFSRSVIF